MTRLDIILLSVFLFAMMVIAASIGDSWQFKGSPTKSVYSYDDMLKANALDVAETATKK
jgi:hypothetical protein